MKSYVVLVLQSHLANAGDVVFPQANIAFRALNYYDQELPFRAHAYNATVYFSYTKSNDLCEILIELQSPVVEPTEEQEWTAEGELIEQRSEWFDRWNTHLNDVAEGEDWEELRDLCYTILRDAKDNL